MNDFAAELRAAARACLPEGAFLRRARGDALFVTDAPRRRPAQNWADVFSQAGFDSVEKDELLFLSPAPIWLERLQARFPEPPDFFCATLARFAALPTEPEALRLFALGARALDGGSDFDAFDRRLRQAAAVALRRGGGGGLYACALLRYVIRKEQQ